MAYERYISKNSKLYIVLNRWHKATIIEGVPHFYPTTVDVLDVEKEELKTVTHLEFEEKLSNQKLKRVIK